MEPEKYTYTFDVWPIEHMGYSQSLFSLFRIMNHRVQMHFTDKEFDRFRADLTRDGMSLRAVLRVPYHEPETVY